MLIKWIKFNSSILKINNISLNVGKVNKDLYKFKYLKYHIHTNTNITESKQNQLELQSIRTLKEKEENNIFQDERFSTTKLNNIKSIPPILKDNLEKNFKFDYATKVQEKVLSLIPIKQDLIVRSQTGSGKTIAYIVPSIEMMLRVLTPEEIEKGKKVSTLILVPTRELVIQISQVIKKLLKNTSFQCMSFIGGTSRKEDLNRITNKRVDIIIATPGRIVDLISSSRVFREQLMSLKMLILDEGDELMNLGFSENIFTIIKNIPINRQTMLFSATLPTTLEDKILNKIFKNKQPLKIDLATNNNNDNKINKEILNINDRLKQKVLISSQNLHLHLIYGILSDKKYNKSILFLSTIIQVQLISGLLKSMKLKVFEIHSQLNQIERLKIQEEYQLAKQGILVTTDISSRGMDYNKVDLVLQWGVPYSIENYLHRIGRTARAGLTGTSIILLSNIELGFIKRLKRQSILLEELNIEAEVTKPESIKLHELNLLCGKIKVGIIKQLYKSSLTYYLSLCKLLYINRKLARSHVKSMIKIFGFDPNTIFDNKLDPTIQARLQQVDQASNLLIKKRGFKRVI